MGLQLSRVAGSLPLCIRMVVDSFQEGGIFLFILHVLRMPAIREPSLFHEEYCSLSGPGAELCLVCFSVLNTSSLVMGESMGSEGRVFCHRWVGGGGVDGRRRVSRGELGPEKACHFRDGDRASDGGRSFPDDVHAVFRVLPVSFLDCHFAANGSVASI